MARRQRSPSPDKTKPSKRARTERENESHHSTPASSNIDTDNEVEEIEPPKQDPVILKKTRAKFEAKWDTKRRTDEEILEEQSDNWKSLLYKHFEDPVIVYINDDVHYKFVCKGNPSSVALTRVRWDTSTGNLSRHVNQCKHKVAPAGKGINDFAHGSTYNKARLRFLCAKWVVKRHRPYTIIQDEELLEIFRMLYGRVEVPHPTTLSKDVREIFQMAQINVAKQLQNYPGRLHLCVDGWTSPNVISFLGVTVHYVVDGKMRNFILDFLKLLKSHTGEYLAEELRGCLERFGILKKLLALVADNASNNNTLTVELESLGGINSAATRIRCFAHIINLVVKAVISLFTKKRKATKATMEDDGDGEAIDSSPGNDDDAESDLTELSSDDDDNAPSDKEDVNQGDAEEESAYGVDADREAADDDEIDMIIKEVEMEHMLSGEDERESQFAVTKLTELAKRVFHSPNLRNDMRTCCEKAEIPYKEMKRAVPTRWNSLAQAIGRAIELRGGIDALVRLGKYDKPAKRGGLKHLRLSMSEWKILTELHAVLDPFLQATERISQTNTPLLHEVIPIIDVLTKTLTTAIGDATVIHPVRVAAARGYAILNKYYSLTDDSIMYRAAMILHPRYKTEYFRRQEWPASWIRTAEELVREQWQKHYRPKPRAAATPASQGVLKQSRSSLFEVLDKWDGDTTVDPYEQYISTPTFPAVKDPLPFWNSQLVGGSETSTAFARMCLDFLSAPAASVDVECAFSRGGLTVTKRRHALSDESVRAATVLSSWASVPGAIPEEAIIKTFREKSKRTKATAIANVYEDADEKVDT